MEELSFEDLDRYLLAQKGKIINQIWYGCIPNKKEAKKAFEGLRKYRDSWLLKNPTWGYMCWNLDNCYKLIKTFFPEHLEMYNKYPYLIQKCDAIRYFILYRYGGIYADMDYYCNRPFDEAFIEYTNDIYFVETPNKVMGDNEIYVSNSLMFSRPGHMFWKKLFIELELHKEVPYYYSRHIAIMFTTGPGILNRVYNRYKHRYHLGFLPHKFFHPYGLNDEFITLNNKPEVYAMHIGKGSWESKDSKIFIFIYKEYKVILFLFLVLTIPSLVVWLSNPQICTKDK